MYINTKSKQYIFKFRMTNRNKARNMCFFSLHRIIKYSSFLASRKYCGKLKLICAKIKRKT